jgi:hypothetical protein
MKIIRTFIAASAVFCYSAFPVFSMTPVMPTLDVANLMQAIDTLYATYDHITATIENVKNTYQQLENQMKALQNINFDDVAKLQEIKDIRSFEDFSNYRHNIKNAVANINANMNYINDIEDTIKDRTVTFGGADFTIASLVGFGKEGEMTLLDLPKVATDYLKEQGSTAIAGWEEKLTYEQKVSLMRKWGMSPRNYANWQMANKITNDIVTKSIGFGNEAIAKIIEKVAKKNEALQVETQMAGESTNSLLRVAVESVGGISEAIAQFEIGIKQVSAAIGAMDLERKIKEDAIAAEQAKHKTLTEETGVVSRNLNPYFW